VKQPQRVRIFGVGFLGGCILAAGFAFFRSADEPAPPPALPKWTPLPSPPPLPTDSPLSADLKPFRAWMSEEGVVRWVFRDKNGMIGRATRHGDTVTVIRADRILVGGNPGIEIPALEAGLKHNGFEILEFHPLRTEFVVAVNPFEPNAVEEARRLLESRTPYILSTEAIPFVGSTPNENSKNENSKMTWEELSGARNR